MTEAQEDGQSTSEFIGQFGVSFYSIFLVADKVIVTSKHSNDTQYIWESDSNEYSVIADPRGNTLGQGMTITLVLKEKAFDYLALDTIKNLIKNIHKEAAKEEKEESYDEAAVEEEEEEKQKPKTKKVEKTVLDEYKAFCKSFSKESDEPVAYIHFTAEGEVTFKSILFVPTFVPRGLFDEYGSKKSDYIKLYVHCVFITDDFRDTMPKILNFVKGVVDSDGLSLNVSCETLQQHKLLKVIRKKLVHKTLDMIKKITTRIEHVLLNFLGSSLLIIQLTLLQLLKRGYEVIYLTEPVVEYCIQALPEFDGKRFQNVAKEGVKFDESEKTKESHEAVEKEFEPLPNWVKDKAIKDKIEKAVVSQCLTESPCALVASQYGWSGNMERIMKAQAYQTGKGISANYHASRKKTFEINPRHPLIRDMLRRIKEDEDDKTVLDLAVVLFETAMQTERMPCLTLWDAEAGGSLELRSSRPAWATSQNAVLYKIKKKKKKKNSRLWWRVPVVPATWGV
uniref:Heat shock protein 90 beta family member 1 n=1 Tax=Gorilla gorilla gorilla TaxID=9595 RepID=G3SHK6_GORGO